MLGRPCTHDTAQSGFLRQAGSVQVKSKTKPEWKKILLRYLDWASLIILAGAVVSAALPNDGAHSHLCEGTRARTREYTLMHAGNKHSLCMQALEAGRHSCCW